MNTVTSKDGTTIAYECTGSGPSLIFIDPAGGYHGWRPMDGLIPMLSSHFAVTTYDRRGRGHSTEVQPYSVERELEDLQAIIAATGEPAFLFGFSSGAVLSLLAASRGLPVKKVVALEPPLERYDEPASPSDLELEVAALIAKGQRREAHTHFTRALGVPDEIVEELNSILDWPQIEALAHTIVYDLIITRSLPTPELSRIQTLALVINSTVTGEFMHHWTKDTAEALPNGVHLTLDGEWHDVPPEILAPVMIAFFKG
jgi:pimeloyl-ACP methyl ester carboxylesterase